MVRTSPHILIRSIGPLEKRRTVSILPSFYILKNRVKPYLKSHLKLQQHDYFMGSNISKNKFWILHLLKYFLGKQDVMTLLCSAVTMPKKRRLRCGYPVFKDRSAGTRGAIANPQILADKLTLSQSGGQIMPTILLLAPLNFQTFLRPWRISGSAWRISIGLWMNL